MKQRTKILATPIAVVALVFTYHVASLDGFDGLVVSALLGHDTQYGSNYSDGAFRRVSVDMTQANLVNLLGPPLRVIGDGQEEPAFWYYSASPTGGHFRERVVQVSDGVVVGKFAEFHVD